MANSQNPTNQSKDPKSRGSAVDLIRDKIAQLQKRHAHDGDTRSKHQMSLIERFWSDHHAHPDKQAAWNKFYADLPDDEKHQLWEEAGGHKPETPQPHDEPKTGKVDENINRLPRNKTEAKQKILEKSKQAAAFTSKNKSRLKPLLTAFVVIAVVLVLNYNEMVVAQVRQYVTPGAGNNSPTIIDPNSDVNISDEPRIIIPKINVDVPVVYNEKSYDEARIQAALERGVVHYGTTPVPGQGGNNVIVGHSSNNFFNSGKYKFAFVLLDRLEVNDTFILHYKGERYIYRVYNKVVVNPDDFSIVQPTSKPTTTLITCTPPGTSWRRLAIQAEQISPAPTESQNNAQQQQINPEEATVVPGNAPSFFQRLWDAIF